MNKEELRNLQIRIVDENSEEIDNGKMDEFLFDTYSKRNNTLFYFHELSVINVQDLLKNLDNYTIEDIEKDNFIKINSKEDVLIYGVSDNGYSSCMNLSTCVFEDFEYKFNELLTCIYGECNTSKGTKSEVQIEMLQ